MAAQSRRARSPMASINFSLGFIVLSIVVYVLNLAAHILVPFVIAIFIWYLINAIARALINWSPGGMELPRTLCFALAISALLLGIFGIYELIRQNAAHVAAAAPDYQKNFDIMKPKVMELLGLDHIPTLPEIVQKIDLAAIIKMMVAGSFEVVGKTVEVLFLTGFLLYEQRFFAQKLSNMSADKSVENHVRHILHNIDIKTQRYIGVKALISTLAGIGTYIVLRVAGTDFAAFWALMAFFLHFIPYVGTFGAIALPVVMTLAQSGIEVALEVTLVLGLTLMSIGHVLDPRLLGEKLNISPICIILSLAVWFMIWGVPGAFLAIPILTIMVIVMSQFEATRPFAVLLSKSGVIEKGEKPK